MGDLQEAVKLFEARFTTVTEFDKDGTHHPSRNEHGEPYVTVCSGGLKPETAHIPALFARLDDAVNAWLNAAMAYYANVKPVGQPHHLYWRKRPELETLPAVDWEGYQTIISRFVVSANPPTPKPKVEAAEQMPRWRCHKIVEAAQIESFNVIVDPPYVVVNWPLTAGLRKGWVVYVPRSIFARGEPKRGDYLVRYDDNYVSWSPKKAFEDGYTLIVEREYRHVTLGINKPGEGLVYAEQAAPTIAGKDDNDQA